MSNEDKFSVLSTFVKVTLSWQVLLCWHQLKCHRYLWVVFTLAPWATQQQVKTVPFNCCGTQGTKISAKHERNLLTLLKQANSIFGGYLSDRHLVDTTLGCHLVNDSWFKISFLLDSVKCLSNEWHAILKSFNLKFKN